MSHRYQHRTLSSSTSFRIIELHPAETHDDPLRCDLHELNILVDTKKRHPQRYEALSYAWGAAVGTCEILCGSNDSTLQITPNCDSALRHLRLISKRRNIFVDAICIDQSPEEHALAERNGQIKLMGEIYRQAYRALIWLGEGDSQTRLMFKLQHAIALCLRMGTAPTNQPGSISWLVWKFKGSIIANQDSLSDIYSRPWFGRLWTLQELALSSAKSLVVCGSDSVLWDDFARAGFWWANLQFGSTTTHRHLIAHFYNQANTRLLWRYQQNIKDRNKEKYLDPVSFLYVSREHQASRPVDKLYGVYSMLQKLGVVLSEPDYDVPVSSACEEVTVSIILLQRSLIVLDVVRSHSRIPGLPSWVPDWTSPSLKGAFVRRDPWYMGSRKTHVNSKIINTRHPHQLPLEGKVVSKVSIRGKHGLWDPFPEIGVMDLDWHIALARGVRYWFCFARSLSDSSAKEGILEAFRESFVMYHINSVFSFNNGASRLWKNVFKWWEQCSLDCEKKNAKYERQWSHWIKNLPAEWRETVESKKHNPDVRFWFYMQSGDFYFLQVRLEIFSRLHMRNIFMTESGHLGIGPSELREDDLIVLFPGALSPMILRPHGDFFQSIYWTCHYSWLNGGQTT